MMGLSAPLAASDPVSSWLQFAGSNRAELWTRAGEHLLLTGTATALAVLIAVPVGILCRRFRPLRAGTLGMVGILQTVPSLAMLAILLTLTGQTGAIPAIVALMLYALLPIVRNTVTGLEGVSEQVMTAARGVGMSPGQRLVMVRLPLALPVIVAGIRTAAVIGVGIATLSTYIGAGGLGVFIKRGLALDDTKMVLLGALPAAALALLVDLSIWILEVQTRPIRTIALRGVGNLARRVALALPAALMVFGVAANLVDLRGRLAVAESAAGRIGTQGTIRIGTKQFGEQLLLGEIMAQLLEARTNLEVDRSNFGLGGTKLCQGALVEDNIDIYPEYTGTAYRSVLNIQEDVIGPYYVFLDVFRAYQEQYDLVWLEPFGFANTFAIVVRESDAREHGWTSVSDLAEHADDLTAGFTSEFAARKEDGYPALKRTYGFAFDEARDFSPDLLPKVLAEEQVDVISAFSTDGRLAVYDLRILRDDRKLWPPYDAAPIIRQDFLQAHPEVRTVLGLLAGKLTSDVMQELNYRTQGADKVPIETVAREFLQDAGLVD